MLSLPLHRPADMTTPMGGGPEQLHPLKERGFRWEELPNRFFHELTDLPSLGSYAGAQPIYQWTRLSILRCLGNTGPMARMLAAIGGLIVEVPAIVGLQHGISKIAGSSPQANLPLATELAQTYRTLTAFRLFGSAAQLFLRRGNLSTGVASALTLGSLYGGIFAANIWNRSAAGGGTPNYFDLARESLVTLAQLEATGRVMRHLPSAGHLELDREPTALGSNFLPKLMEHPALVGISQRAVVPSGNWFNKGEPGRGGSRERNADTINSGPLGKFVMETVEGVPVFIPLVESPKAKGKGTVLLISGLSTNHTRLGELPRLLAKEGWRVRVIVYPGFEKLNDNSFLKRFRPADLAKHWQSSIERVTGKIIRKQDLNGEIYIGGYSMGGVGAAAFAYGSLPPLLQRRISGLILASPSFSAAYFETPSKFRNWFGRRVFVPVNAFLRREYTRASNYNSDIAPYLESSIRRPWSVDYAAVLYCEAGKEVVSRYKGQADLPRVLLIHTGAGDPVVSPKAAVFVREVFGDKLVREILLPPEDGHYPLVGMHRTIAQDGVLEFLAK